MLAKLARGRICRAGPVRIYGAAPSPQQGLTAPASRLVQGRWLASPVWGACENMRRCPIVGVGQANGTGEPVPYKNHLLFYLSDRAQQADLFWFDILKHM
jgi:hypothetical protein